MRSILPSIVVVASKITTTSLIIAIFTIVSSVTTTASAATEFSFTSFVIIIGLPRVATASQMRGHVTSRATRIGIAMVAWTLAPIQVQTSDLHERNAYLKIKIYSSKFATIPLIACSIYCVLPGRKVL